MAKELSFITHTEIHFRNSSVPYSLSVYVNYDLKYSIILFCFCYNDNDNVIFRKHIAIDSRRDIVYENQ